MECEHQRGARRRAVPRSQSAERDPRNAARRCRPEFLRPYRGYQDIFVRGNFGTSNYHALQLQVNRRYIRGVQFGAPTRAAARCGIGDEDPARVSLARPMRRMELRDRAVQPGSQPGHQLHVGHPGRQQAWSNNVSAACCSTAGSSPARTRSSPASGRGVILTTTDNFDFTGGDGGTAAASADESAGRDVRQRRPAHRAARHRRRSCRCRAAARSAHGLVQHGGFARPSGRGDYGDAPRNVDSASRHQQLELALFKNFPFGGGRESPVPRSRATTC